MIKKVITNFCSSKASGPDCVPVVVLKNCEPELSYIVAQIFNMCLKESFQFSRLLEGFISGTCI